MGIERAYVAQMSNSAQKHSLLGWRRHPTPFTTKQASNNIMQMIQDDDGKEEERKFISDLVMITFLALLLRGMLGKKSNQLGRLIILYRRRSCLFFVLDVKKGLML